MTKLISILLIMSFGLTFAQDNQTSIHTVIFYKNDKPKKVKKAELSIIINKDTIYAKRIGNTFVLPNINSEEATFRIKVNDVDIESSLKSWQINLGSKIAIGKIKNLNHLISVAEFMGLKKEHESWEICSKRYFIFNNLHTLDIEDIGMDNEIETCVIVPNTKNTKITIQKVVTQK